MRVQLSRYDTVWAETKTPDLGVYNGALGSIGAIDLARTGNNRQGLADVRMKGIINRHALEGVYVDRTDQGLTPRFVKIEPPSDANIAAVVERINHRVIRKLHQLEYLEASIEAAVATGYDPLGEDKPKLARTPWAAVRS
jgi:hypothetical protein